MRKFALGLIITTFLILSLCKANEPIQDDRNEVLINWHNDKGEKKTFKIDDIEKDNGNERIHSKTLLQKYTRSTCTPCSSDSDSFGSLGSTGSCNSCNSCGSSNSISSSSSSGGSFGNLGSCNSCSGYNNGCNSGSCYGCYGGNDCSVGSSCVDGTYGKDAYCLGTGNNCGCGYNSAYGSGYGLGTGNAYGGLRGSLRGNNNCGCGVIGTRDYNGLGCYDGNSFSRGNDLSYEQMCHLLNKERANRLNRNNARAYCRANDIRRDNKDYNAGSQINKVCRENERNCLIDACDAAKIASSDSRNDKCYSNKENQRANEIKRIHNLVNCANRKNEHLNMHEKERDNLHSHKRIVTEFDKLEHFKKCSENCKDAEKGRRANVNKANNVKKHARRRKGHRYHNSRYAGKCDINQQRNKDEANYCDTNSAIMNKKCLGNKDICESNNDYTCANSDKASCVSKDDRACSNDRYCDDSCKYGKADKVVDYDSSCENRNSRDRYGRCNNNWENKRHIYPRSIGGGCAGGCGPRCGPRLRRGCSSGYVDGCEYDDDSCDSYDTCDDDF